MSNNGDSRKFHFVTISLGKGEGRIEKLAQAASDPELIRFSCWNQGRLLSEPLDFSEKELVDLLQKAVRAGILSPDFINNLHSAIEI